MAEKIMLLVLTLVVLVVAGNFLLRKQIKQYNPRVWGGVEFFWYMISFVAVCIGLMEIDRIERLNQYHEREKQLLEQFEGTKGMLYAQTRLLGSAPGKAEKEGVDWFFRMYALLEEGVHSQRWESFLRFTRSYVFREPGLYADPRTNAVEFNWPSDLDADPTRVYLKNEMKWIVDDLVQLQLQKRELNALRPVENTNYLVRYVLILFYLVGLSLKLLKIVADYRRIRAN